MSHYDEPPRTLSADPLIFPLAISLINLGVPGTVAIFTANLVVGAAIPVGTSCAWSRI